MKGRSIYLAVIAVLLAFCIRGEVLQRRYRAALLDARMKSQITAIKIRARDFMEMNLHQPFVPAGEVAYSAERYELRIPVPAGKLPEFLAWMRDTSVQPVSVDGWPSSSGSDINLGNSEFSYRVYYGQKPSDWK